MEPHLTVTSLVRKPPNYSHPGSVPNYIPQCKLPPCNKVTSPLRSLLPSPVRDLNSEVPLYVFLCNTIKWSYQHKHSTCMCLIAGLLWIRQKAEHQRSGHITFVHILAVYWPTNVNISDGLEICAIMDV